MSKYTTEVRFICENACGYDTSRGANEVDDIVSKSWNKIFTSNFPIYDEAYRPILCQKILKHFYLREICCETVGIWKMWMNEKLEMIMPYYNQMYESELIKFNPLYDVDVNTTSNRKTVYDEDTTGNHNSDYTRTDNLQQKRTDDLNTLRTDNLSSLRTDNLQNIRTDDLVHESDKLTYDLFSNTPQGGLNGVDNESYLTDARKVTEHLSDENTGTQRNDATGTQKVDNTGTQNVDNTGTVLTENTGTQKNVGKDDDVGTKDSTNIDDYTEKVLGKRGGATYSSMLNEFRTTFLNIDMMICDELEELFMELWQVV